MRVIRWVVLTILSALAAVGAGYLLGLLRPRLHPLEPPTWSVPEDPVAPAADARDAPSVTSVTESG